MNVSTNRHNVGHEDGGNQVATSGRFPTWPPPPDFAISLDKSGNPVSYFRDSIWNFSHWARKRLVLNMGDGPKRMNCPPICERNALLLRLVTAWLLFGPRPVSSSGTLKSKFKLVRPLFAHCTSNGIVATDLSRFPAVIATLASELAPSRFAELVSFLHSLYEQRDAIGFTILDHRGIKQLSQGVPSHSAKQTPYIPPRIWNYILGRCHSLIDDYLLNQDKIEQFYKVCLTLYDEGHLSDKTLGHYRYTTLRDEYQLTELLERWVPPIASAYRTSSFDIRAIASLLSMVCQACAISIAASSLMRIEEIWRLRCDCLTLHRDGEFSEVYLIRGETSKTGKDDNAIWVTSKWSARAIQAAASAARLKVWAAVVPLDMPDAEAHITNPYLIPRSYEPWSSRDVIERDFSVRQSIQQLNSFITNQSMLFNADELVITRDDLDAARRINPTLDNEKFAEGKHWVVSWHQFRRTGAVNMFASGVVSDSSLQHQLKHSRRIMTHYYAQGFSSFALNERTKTEVLATMYEMAAHDADDLFDDRFISAHGDQHKELVLAPVNGKELSELRKLAKAGRIPWRETPFGGCTKPGPCEFGGFENFIHCGGGDGKPPCVHGLFDLSKRPIVEDLHKRISLQLVEAPAQGPLMGWLQEMAQSLRNILSSMTKSEHK
jgi:integrase